MGLAELRGSAVRRCELFDQQGQEMGRISRQITPATGAWRVYEISFYRSPGVAVRALTLAALVCVDMRHIQ